MTYSVYAEKVNAAAILASAGDQKAQTLLKSEFTHTKRGSEQRDVLAKAFRQWDRALFEKLDQDEVRRLEQSLEEVCTAINILSVLIGLIIGGVMVHLYSTSEGYDLFSTTLGTIAFFVVVIIGGVCGWFISTAATESLLSIERQGIAVSSGILVLVSIGIALALLAIAIGLIIAIGLALVALFFGALASAGD